jgi:hypothetical protein
LPAPALLALCALPIAGSARAQATGEFGEAPRGIHEHDGFLARVTLGPALAWIDEQADYAVLDASGGGSDIESTEFDLSGGGFALGLDAGYAITSSFAWHARLLQCVVPDPGVTGVSPDPIGQNARTLLLFAPAISWFGPLGLYAVAAAGVAFTRKQSYEGEGGLGDAGPGVNLDLGIEGWVAEQLALGTVLRGAWSSTSGSSRDGDRSQRALALALALSLTYQ